MVHESSHLVFTSRSSTIAIRPITPDPVIVAGVKLNLDLSSDVAYAQADVSGYVLATAK